MADSTITIQVTTLPGDKIDAEELVVGANTVKRERDQIAGKAATEIADVKGADPTSGMFGLVVRNIPGASLQHIDGTGVAGTPAGGVASVQGVVGGTPLPISGTITASDASVGAIGAAVPGSGQQNGGPDAAGLLRANRLHDLDSGASAEFNLGVSLRKTASGGSVELGTSSDPVRVDPTGTTTQPVSAASLPLPAGAATSANQTNKAQYARLTDGTDDANVTAAGRLEVDGSGVTQPISAVSLPLPTGAATEATLATRAADRTTAAAPFSTRLSDGAAFYKATTPADTQPISAASLPLPTGAATEATLATRLGDATFTGRINTQGQKTMALSTPIVIASDQSAIPVTGTITATDASVGLTGAAVPASSQQNGGPDAAGLLRAHRIYDVDSGAGTEFTLGVSLRKTASGGSVELGTNADPVQVGDAGGSLTVDNSTLSVVGGGLEATALRVTVATDNVVSVDDNGGSLTVDGTVSVSGTVDTELPAAVTLADDTANPTAPAVGAFGMVWDGATWDRSPGTSVDGTLVNLGANNDVTVTSGTVTANQGTSPWVVGDGGGSLTVDTPQLPAALVGGRLDENVGAWLGSIAPTVGSKTSANSIPVVLASDQTQLPAALVGGRLDTNNGAWLGSTAPTVGQKTMANSVPVVISSDQTFIPPRTTTAGTPAGKTVSTSAVLVQASNASRRSIVITNNGATNVFIGNASSVTSSGANMGVKLAPNGSYSDNGDGLYTGDIYGIGDAVSASQNVSTWERT